MNRGAINAVMVTCTSSVIVVNMANGRNALLATPLNFPNTDDPNLPCPNN